MSLKTKYNKILNKLDDVNRLFYETEINWDNPFLTGTLVEVEFHLEEIENSLKNINEEY